VRGDAGDVGDLEVVEVGVEEVEEELGLFLGGERGEWGRGRRGGGRIAACAANTALAGGGGRMGAVGVAVVAVMRLEECGGHGGRRVSVKGRWRPRRKCEGPPPRGARTRLRARRGGGGGGGGRKLRFLPGNAGCGGEAGKRGRGREEEPVCARAGGRSAGSTGTSRTFLNSFAGAWGCRTSSRSAALRSVMAVRLRPC
jgi:hypothetical protein